MSETESVYLEYSSQNKYCQLLLWSVLICTYVFVFFSLMSHQQLLSILSCDAKFQNRVSQIMDSDVRLVVPCSCVEIIVCKKLVYNISVCQSVRKNICKQLISLDGRHESDMKTGLGVFLTKFSIALSGAKATFEAEKV